MDGLQKEQILGAARIMQIIMTAMIMGVLFFAAIVLLIGGEAPENEDGGIFVITVIAVCFAMVALVAARLVPPIIQRNMRRNIIDGAQINNNISAEQAAKMGDTKLLTINYQTTMIVGAAILEGAAFMNLAAYMLERQTVGLFVAATMVTAMFFKFPTVMQAENWIADELEIIKASRQLRD